MTEAWPTNAQVRDAARDVAPELTTILGVANSAVPASAAMRMSWVRAVAGNIKALKAADLLVLHGYLLAHRTTADTSGSQGSTSAPIGGGSTAGALSGVTVGGMSLQYSGQVGVMGQVPGMNVLRADLGTTNYGRAALGLMETRPALSSPRNA